MPVLVRPEEWVKLTAVAIGKRHSDLVDIDRAYKDYFFDKSLTNALILKRTLDLYLARHNTTDWDRVERNVKSKGKMKQIHDLVKIQIGNRTEEQVDMDDRVRIAKLTLLSPDKRAQQALLTGQDQARLGVLYLLAHTRAETEFLKIFLEGGLSVVGNVTADASPALSAADHAGRAAASVVSTVSTVGGAASGTAVDLGRAHLAARGPAPRPPSAEWENMVELTEMGRSPATRPATPERATEEKTEGTLMKLAREVVNWLVQNERTAIAISESVIIAIVKAATKFIMVHGLPIVGALTDITQGVVQAAAAAGPIIQQHMLKKKFDIQTGHPEILANSIENQMKWAIGKGLYSALKGGLRAGLTAVSLGAAALGDIIAAAIEFVTKALSRWYEASKMNQIFEAAKTIYQNSKEVVHAPDGTGRIMECVFPRPASLATNRLAFTKQFEEWCDACPCIAMLTLNSGICGDLMQMMRMFENPVTTVSQEAFQAGAEYFNNLKRWGARYLKDSGFVFSSSDSFVAKLLEHACGKHAQGGQSHAEQTMTFWQRVFTFAGA